MEKISWNDHVRNEEEKKRNEEIKRLGGPQGRSGRVRKISPPTGIRSPDRPTRGESLYRLRYRGPQLLGTL
jgi:hypothetical protein